MATWTQAQLDAINEAISQGVLEVKYADKTVTYRSLEDMLRIKGLMEADLGLLDNSTAANRTLTSFSKGYLKRNRNEDSDTF